MNKAQLEKRIAELQKSLEQVQANGNALVGAIQDCNYWLKQLEQTEAQERKAA
jgi:septal ring factor EnvC (AmiA/AmiB activator)